MRSGGFARQYQSFIDPERYWKLPLVGKGAEMILTLMSGPAARVMVIASGVHQFRCGRHSGPAGGKLARILSIEAAE